MTVLNKHKCKDIPADAIYIGRGSMWGNPFPITKEHGRNYVCDMHAEYLKREYAEGRITVQQLAGLHGKTLVCFCAPARCHGDTLVKAAAWAFNELNPQTKDTNMDNEFKLIVAGGRDFDDYDKLSRVIFGLAEVEYADKDVSIVSGMARGADALGVRFAKEHSVELHKFPADWNTYGKAAGHRRNAEMAKVADGLVAFWDGRSAGTRNMIETMKMRNKPVHMVMYDPIKEPEHKGFHQMQGRFTKAKAGPVQWARRGGYECSSKGDRRFSALNAVMPDGRTIEMHYQCDVKGYQPGGTDWRLGKGKPPLDPTQDLWAAYLALWQTWAQHNPDLIEQLERKASEFNNVLSDMFATTDVNQARALAYVLNGRRPIQGL